MNEDFSPPRLIELLHRYHPLHLHGDNERYGESEQYQRLVQLRAQALKNPTSWRGLLARLREALPQCKVEDWTVLFSDDNCWRVRVNLPEVLKLPGGQDEVRTVVVLVSILAPVYVLYSSFRRYSLVEKRAWP